MTLAKTWTSYAAVLVTGVVTVLTSVAVAETHPASEAVRADSCWANGESGSCEAGPFATKQECSNRRMKAVGEYRRVTSCQQGSNGWTFWYSDR